MVQVGDIIKILYLDDEYAGDVYDGSEGEVTHIDSIGQIHGTWGNIALIPGVDKFQVLFHY